MRRWICGTLILLSSAFAVRAADIDQALARAIAGIPAIDDHCHCDPADPARGASWSAGDPLGAPSYPAVVPLRTDNPAWSAAWRALYGIGDNTLPGEALAAKRRLMREKGDAWPAYVLDHAGVEVALVNAPRFGPGQAAPRFRWVPFADPLLVPFAGTKSLLAFPGGPVSIDGLMREAGLRAPPKTLGEFESKLIAPTLTRWKAAGAPAIKFLSAYRRALDFAPADPSARALIEAAYSKGASGKALTVSEQKTLEDWLFNAIAVQAGRVGLVVQIHTGNGNGPYFDNARANPTLLEPALNSKPLRETRFVLVHGGWPYPLIAQAMIDKPNTYVDFSAETFYLTPHALADVLRGWLEWQPEKVLFGTDAYSDANTPLSDWEEKEWLMTRNARQALGIALTAMMRDGDVSRERAIEIARLVLRENARKLYGLD